MSAIRGMWWLLQSRYLQYKCCNTCGCLLCVCSFLQWMSYVPGIHNILISAANQASSPKLQTLTPQCLTSQDFLWNLGKNLFYFLTNPCILPICETILHGQLQVLFSAWEVARPPFTAAQQLLMPEWLYREKRFCHLCFQQYTLEAVTSQALFIYLNYMFKYGYVHKCRCPLSMKFRRGSQIPWT